MHPPVRGGSIFRTHLHKYAHPSVDTPSVPLLARAPDLYSPKIPAANDWRAPGEKGIPKTVRGFYEKVLIFYEIGGDSNFSASLESHSRTSTGDSTLAAAAVGRSTDATSTAVPP